MLQCDDIDKSEFSLLLVTSQNLADCLSLKVVPKCDQLNICDHFLLFL